MPTTEQCRIRIQRLRRPGLLRLWQDIIDNNTPWWNPGQALEFLILRAFEIEGARIRWPFHVTIDNLTIEQIDGVVHLLEKNLSILVEFKDRGHNINIEPIAKLRNQLQRRPSNVIGSVFSTMGFTAPSLWLSRFLSPQTILLWESDHIEYCLRNAYFIDGLLKKYHHAIEEGFSNFDPSI